MADLPFLSNNRRESLTLVAQAALVLLAIFLLAAGVYQMWHVFILLFIALVLAAAMRPVVIAARRRGVPKVVTVLLIYITFIAALVGSILLVWPILATQVGSLITSAPQWYAQLYATVKNSPNLLLQQLAGSLPDPALLASGQLSLGTGATGKAAEVAGGVLGQAIGFGSSTATFVVETISTLVLALYWTVEQPRFERLWLSLLPTGDRARYLTIWREIEAKMGAYVRGIGIQCLSIGLMVGIGYWILGIHYFLGLAIVAALCEAVPLIGPFAAAIPALLVAATQGPDKILLVIIFTLIVQEIESQVLVPKVMERAVGVSPLVTLLAILGFGSVMGLLGIVLAIPFAAVIQVLLDSFVLNKEVVLDDEASSIPLTALQIDVRKLQRQLRTRYRSNKELLEPQKADDVNHRLETIAERMGTVLAQAANAVDPTTPSVSAESMHQLSVELTQVEPMLAAAKSKSAEANGETDQDNQDTKQLIESMGTMVDEAHQAVADAATEVDGAQEAADALSAADRGPTSGLPLAPLTPVKVPA